MKTKIPDAVLAAEVSRRSLIKATATGGLAMVSNALTLPSSWIAHAVDSAIPTKSDEKVIWSACTVNYGSCCLLRIRIMDGEIGYVETDDIGDDNYDGPRQVCVYLRRRSMHRRVYNPDRLKYPAKRVGARSEDKSERINWEEVYDIVATKMQRLIRRYGNKPIYLNYSIGTLNGTMTRSWPPGNILVARPMNCYGGYLSHYSDYPSAQVAESPNYTYDGQVDGNSPSGIEDNKLVVLFGNSPDETRMSGGGATYYLEQARQKFNTCMIIIDPHYTDTGVRRGDEWIPICPGADTALANGLAYVMITKDLVDQELLDKYCVGYDGKTLPANALESGHHRAYILGEESDNVAKTPKWASQITGVPADKIIKLAHETGSTKPTFISQEWGPQRHTNGEIAAHAISMLAILTGNTGIDGGDNDAHEGSYSLPFARTPAPESPIQTSIFMLMWTDATECGPETTALRDGVCGKDRLDMPIKMIWNYAGSCLTNQRSKINRTHEILQGDKKCELIVTIDCHMTSSAKYADILLPGCTASEQMNFALGASYGDMSHAIFDDQVIKPRFECRVIYEMTSEPAERLDIKQQFTEGRTQKEWMRYLYAQSRETIPELPTSEELREQGIFKECGSQGHHVVYKAFRENPQVNPLATSSGKIEIYSQALADIAATWELSEGDVIDPLLIYTPGSESYQGLLNKQYPLQLTGFCYKSRVHLTYDNVDVLKTACRQEMWINPFDAQERSISDGDKVRISDDRGEVYIETKVTP